MSLTYRAMIADGDKPKTGEDKRCLGVKIGNGEFDDLPRDQDECVSPGTGGMSVASHWRKLPGHRIPKRLNKIELKARGSDNLHCWRYGVVADSSTHGVVEPAERMSAAAYLFALADTPEGWVVDEE